jgi:hypothetical protein
MEKLWKNLLVKLKKYIRNFSPEAHPETYKSSDTYKGTKSRF